jgi:hypothetical protein
MSRALRTTQTLGLIEQHVYPANTIAVIKATDSVTVDLGNNHITCNDDKTWHIEAQDKDQGIKLDMVHHWNGYPLLVWQGEADPF